MDVTWIYWIAAIAVLWITVRYLMVYRVVSNLGCRIPSIERAESDEIPGDTTFILDLADRELVQLGFRYLCHLQIFPALYQALDDEPEFAKAFYHPQLHTSALVTINSFWQLNNPVKVTFSTLYRNGKSIQTSSFLGGNGLPLPERIDLKDAETHDIEQLWQSHRNRNSFDGSGEPVHLNTAQIFAKASQIEIEQLMSYWVDKGVFISKQESGEALALSHKHAFRLAKWLLSALGKASKKALSLASVPSEVLTAWNGLIIRRLITENKQKTSGQGKFLLFAGSAVFFAIAFGVVFSWGFVPILLGVILFHELGHFFAMKWTGYKDLQIFFVPLLGAAVTGTKHYASPIQQLFVYLMGPMPGLLLSLPLLLYGYTESDQLAISIGMVAFIINYLNLLPVTPLDGGRVLDTLLFTRFPRAQFIFSLLSASALLVAGFYTHDQILLVVGGLLVLSLPSSWTASQINRELQKIKQQSDDVSDARQLTINTLLSPALDGIRRDKKLNYAKQLLRNVQTRHATPAVVVAGMIIYLVCLVSPFAVVVGFGATSFGEDKLVELGALMLAGDEEMVSSENWNELLAKADNDEERWRILSTSFYLLSENSPEIAVQNLEQAIEISYSFDLENPLILRTWYMLESRDLSEVYKMTSIDKAIAHYQAIAQSSYVLAQLYQMRAGFISQPEQKIDAYQKAISELESAHGVDDSIKINTRRQLAQVYYQLGQFPQAEQLLRDNTELQLASKNMNLDGVELIWFYIETQQNEVAVELANSLLDKLALLDRQNKSFQFPQIIEPMMWLACENGQRVKCLEYMDEIIAHWKVQFDVINNMDNNEGVWRDHYSCTIRVIAFHLLGEEQRARDIAATFISDYPEFQVATGEVSNEFLEQDWNRTHLEMREGIQNTYHIAKAYDVY